MPNQKQIEFVFNKIGYTPTPEQWKIHLCDSRTRLVAGGERAGKSFLSANDMLARFYEGKLFWLVAQDYERTRAEFDYICEGLDRLGFRYKASKQVNPGRIDVEGGYVFETKSALDPRKLAMRPPDGVLICEASQVDYETYLRLRYRVAEKRGWLLLSGTFESSLGWYPELYLRGQAPNEELVSFSLPTWTNLAIFPGGRDDPEIKALEEMSSEEWFMERFGGQPCPPKGIVFNEFRNNIHVGTGDAYEFDPLGIVHLWVDPGFASAYAVEVAQIKGEHVYIIDEIFERGKTTSDIIKICKQRPWWDRVLDGAIDVAARQHQAMPAVSEVWVQEAGVPLRSQRVEIRDGIERVKNMLIVNPLDGLPRLHINSRCQGLISEMGGCPNPIDGQSRVYTWKLDRDGNLMSDLPEDKNNHACKALAYGLIDSLGYSTVQRRAKVKFF